MYSSQAGRGRFTLEEGLAQSTSTSAVRVHSGILYSSCRLQIPCFSVLIYFRRIGRRRLDIPIPNAARFRVETQNRKCISC